MSALDILKKYWGYSGFRDLQEDIINSVLEGRDTLGLMPTGGGKSITFQVPALMLDGLTLVVTPIISLMKDQVDNLIVRHIKATYLHAGLSLAERRKAIDKCLYGNCKFLYVSPERLSSDGFIDKLRLMNVSLIVVDEAHCISQWGYDFRPSYLKISAIRRIFPAVPVLALTATATPDVVTDIMEKLEFHVPNVFSKSFKRDNISYVVRQCDDKIAQLVHILRSVPGSAIVYVRSRRKTKMIADELTFNHITADYYHAGLDNEDKNDKQNKWKQGDTRVFVATNAFGMGIDKPDVRIVVHIDVPNSLEEYYQEAGRAGRDGNRSWAVLLVSDVDNRTLKRRITESFPDKDFILNVYERAGNFLNVSVGGGFNQIYDFNFTLFCKTFDYPLLPAANALKILTQSGYIEFIEEIDTQSRVMILADKSDLYHIPDSTPEDEQVLQALLRTYSGLFADYVFINEAVMARRFNLTQEVIYNSLLKFTRLHLLHYVPRKRTPYIIYTTSREELRYVQISRAAYEDRRAVMERRIGSMLHYCFCEDQCREAMLRDYFGENDIENCGHCDVCIDRRKRMDNTYTIDNIIDGIMYMVSTRPRTITDFTSTLSFRADDIIAAVTRLVEDGFLTFSPTTAQYSKP